MTLRYDVLDRDRVAAFPAELERLGLHPYMVIDDWEEPQVRKRFGVSEALPLPWPHVARMRANGGVTVYDLATSRPDLTPIALEPGLAPLYSAPKPIVIRPR